MGQIEEIVSDYQSLLEEHRQLCTALKNARKFVREVANINSQDFAEAIGITSAQLSRWTDPESRRKQAFRSNR